MMAMGDRAAHERQRGLYMRPPPTDELIRRGQRAAFVRELQTPVDGSPYIDDTDLQERSRAYLGDGDQTQQLIAWYVAHGGYVGPGRRYLKEKLRDGIRALWEVAD